MHEKGYSESIGMSALGCHTCGRQEHAFLLVVFSALTDRVEGVDGTWTGLAYMYIPGELQMKVELKNWVI